MSALNVFIDGTWLLVQCAAGQSMANATETPTSRFALDFAKLDAELLRHAQEHGGGCDQIGECYVATSIFALPADFDNWPTEFEGITSEMIERTRRAVFARDAFVRAAESAGYKMDAVFRPLVRAHPVRQLAGLAGGRYQEKQVDTSVVALLVRSAITKPQDYHLHGMS